MKLLLHGTPQTKPVDFSACQHWVGFVLKGLWRQHAGIAGRGSATSELKIYMTQAILDSLI